MPTEHPRTIYVLHPLPAPARRVATERRQRRAVLADFIFASVVVVGLGSAVCALAGCDAADDSDDLDASPLDVLALDDGDAPADFARAPADSCARLLFVDLRVPGGDPNKRAVVVRADGCQEAQAGLSVSVGPGEASPEAFAEHRWPVTKPVEAGPDGCRVLGGGEAKGWGLEWSQLGTKAGDWPTYHAVLWNADGEAIDSVSIPGDLDPSESGKDEAPVSGVRIAADGLWHTSADYGGLCATWEEWQP